MTIQTIFSVNHNSHDNSIAKNSKFCGYRLIKNAPDIENNLQKVNRRHHQFVQVKQKKNSENFYI